MARDDFSEKTKDFAAKRVSYRCSFPDCHKVTVGASMEGNDKVSSIGEAAHICAASPGGKRYDSSMTVEERKSIDNCIWMCRTHARLIDTDETIYTVEKLRKWKKQAEKRSSDALASSDFLKNCYDENEDSLELITRIFEDLIIDGSFNVLFTHLEQYKTSLSKAYDEFVLRYKVIYDIYCKRSHLIQDLEQYLMTSRTGIDWVIEELLSFRLNDALKIIIDYCDDGELLKLTKLIIDGEFVSVFFNQPDNGESFSVSETRVSLIQRMVTNHIIANGWFDIKHPNGEAFRPYNHTFYYRIQAAVYEMQHKIFHLKTAHNAETDKQFEYVVQNFDKWKYLDGDLSFRIWGMILIYAMDNRGLFEELYEKCPDEMKKIPEIFDIYCGYQRRYEPNKVTTNSVLEFCQKTGDYGALCSYLSKCNRQDGIVFLDEHQYLYRVDSCFLHIKLIVYSDYLEIGNVRAFLKKYESLYPCDLMFHCLCAFFEEDKEILSQELEWLNENLFRADYTNLMFAIRVLGKNKKWNILCDLADRGVPDELLNQIAMYLLSSEESVHIKKADAILEKLIADNHQGKNLYYNKGYASRKLGALENAKKYFQLEYDISGDSEALLNLIGLRCETKQFIEDNYFENAKKIAISDAQQMIGYIFQHLFKYKEACVFFLRALLINEENVNALNGYLFAGLQIPSGEAKNVKENTVCVLQNDDGTIQIAIHTPEVLNGISPNKFANTMHYSSDDLRISDLMYSENGDKVIFQDCEYTIKSIHLIHDFIMKYVMSNVERIPGTRAFSASTPEESIQDILAYMKESTAATDGVIKEYNEMELRWPLSIFSHLVGKDLMQTWEFLMYGNSEKIRNNPFLYNEQMKGKKILLSFDSIIVLNHMGLLETILENFSVVCPAQVRHRLITEIENEQKELSSDQIPGYMTYRDDKLSIIKHTKESRRERNSFLMRLQSFVNSLEPSEAYDFVCSDPELQAKFSENHMHCESGCLGLAQNHENCILISDDQFLYSFANMLNISTIGICSMICACDLSCEELLDCSRKLACMNYSNYLPIDLYHAIYRKATQCADGNALEMLSQWFLSDGEKEASDYHRKIIIQLFLSVEKDKSEVMNYNHLLGVAALTHFSHLYPIEFQRRIDNIFGEYRGKWG